MAALILVLALVSCDSTAAPPVDCALMDAPDRCRCWARRSESSSTRRNEAAYGIAFELCRIVAASGRGM